MSEPVEIEIAVDPQNDAVAEFLFYQRFQRRAVTITIRSSSRHEARNSGARASDYENMGYFA
jgi:hypothetical protein